MVQGRESVIHTPADLVRVDYDTVYLWKVTLSPFWGFIKKFLLKSSNMIVFLLWYCLNFPQITPRGFVWKENMEHNKMSTFSWCLMVISKFFHKFLVEGALYFGMIFLSPSGTESNGGTCVGMESDEGRGVYSSIIRPKRWGIIFSTLGKNSNFWKKKKKREFEGINKIWHCDPPTHRIITKKCQKIDLCPWLGGTCNCEIGEGFDRWRLALGNNSDIFEE